MMAALCVFVWWAPPFPSSFPPQVWIVLGLVSSPLSGFLGRLSSNNRVRVFLPIPRLRPGLVGHDLTIT